MSRATEQLKLNNSEINMSRATEQLKVVSEVKPTAKTV